MAMTVPPEIVAVLAGSPEVGSWEPMFLLLTVDEPGFRMYACCHALSCTPTFITSMRSWPARRP